MGCVGTFALLTFLCCNAQQRAYAQSSPEAADTKSLQSDYDRLLDGAVAAFGAGDFERAHGLFKQAYEVRPNARVLRGIGIAALRLGRYTEAKLELTAALADPRQPLTASQRDEVSKLMAWMQSSLGTLRLHVKPRASLVTVDDEPTSYSDLLLHPGVHHVRVIKDGFQAQEHTANIEAAKDESLEVRLVPAKVAPDNVARSALPAAAPDHALGMAARPDMPAERVDSSNTSLFESWWFWAAVGVVAVGGAATAIALSTTPSPKPFEQGGVGGVVFALEHKP